MLFYLNKTLLLKQLGKVKGLLFFYYLTKAHVEFVILIFTCELLNVCLKYATLDCLRLSPLLHTSANIRIIARCFHKCTACDFCVHFVM